MFSTKRVNNLWITWGASSSLSCFFSSESDLHKICAVKNNLKTITYVYSLDLAPSREKVEEITAKP